MDGEIYKNPNSCIVLKFESNSAKKHTSIYFILVIYEKGTILVVITSSVTFFRSFLLFGFHKKKKFVNGSK